MKLSHDDSLHSPKNNSKRKQEQIKTITRSDCQRRNNRFLSELLSLGKGSTKKSTLGGGGGSAGVIFHFLFFFIYAPNGLKINFRH